MSRSPEITSSTPRALPIAGAFVVGVLTAAQSRINGELAVRLADGYVAAMISFGSGLLILLALTAVWAPGRRGVGAVVASVRAGRTPWWYLGGGVAGGFFVLSQGLTTGMLGVALFTIAVVSGQAVSGLIVDRVGMGTMAPVAITVTRVAGSVLALAAVGSVLSAQLRVDIPVWMILLPLIAGIGLGWQQAANGQVRVVAGSALTATLTNFVTGFIVLVVAGVVHGMVAGWPANLPTDGWLYLGGTVGVLFIGLAVVVVRHTGVLILGLGAISGQLVMSLSLDLVVPLAGYGVGLSTFVGTALALGAVALAATPSRALTLRRTRRTTRGTP